MKIRTHVKSGTGSTTDQTSGRQIGSWIQC